MSKQYTILDNGGRPFKVHVYNNNHLQVFTHEELDDFFQFEDPKYNILVYETDFINIFIGQHPVSMKIYDDNYDLSFEGNSILVEIDNNTYIFIGINIFKFNSLCKINYYLSIIGNSSVPYPYAIDEQNNIYLMIENTIMIPENNTFEYIKKKGDPYMFYYGHIRNKKYKYVKHELPNYNEIVARI